VQRIAAVSFLFLALCTSLSAHCISSFVICFSGFFQDQSESSSGGRAAPMAKTQEELDTYVAATGQADTATAENAVAEFAAKYPESELRASAYAQLMQRYQQSGNAVKTVAMGRKAIELDPEHTVALVVTASVLADTTDTSTPDRDARLTEAIKAADEALKTLANNRFVAPDAPPDQLQKIKAGLAGAAHTAKGIALKTKKDYAAAESEFKAALAAGNAQEPSTLLHLSIVQDYLNKHSEALANVNAAIAAADAQQKRELAAAARKQQARLKVLLANAKAKGKTR
jgi:tetratricopeptide (TPR) repeat protein